jgi:hypothetical protein
MTTRGRPNRGQFSRSRLRVGTKPLAATSGKQGHAATVARIAAIRASWPTEALLDVLNCRHGVESALTSLRVVAKQWETTLDCPSQSARFILGLTTVGATAVMHHMIKHQNPRHEAALSLVGLFVTFCKEKCEQLQYHAPLWETPPWGPLTPAERIGCAVVLDDCRKFMRALVEVPAPWLKRLRRCQDPACREFFWIETGPLENRGGCTPSHGRQHRRLKSPPRR